MKTLIVLATIAFSLATGLGTAEAKDKDKRHKDRDRDREDYRDYDRRDYGRYDRDRSSRSYSYSRSYGSGYRGSSRTIYVIERNRPVRRVVYSDGRGYYRILDGRRSYIRSKYYTSYPTRYYYSDGRPRLGVTVRF